MRPPFSATWHSNRDTNLCTCLTSMCVMQKQLTSAAQDDVSESSPGPEDSDDEADEGLCAPLQPVPATLLVCSSAACHLDASVAR